jgi:hypothetical protein
MPLLQESVSPLRTFVAAFVLSFVSGLTAHLREGKPCNPWSACLAFAATAGLSSGFLGLGLALLWYQKFQDNVYFLIGVCVLAGLCGRPMVDAVTIDFIATVKRWLAVLGSRGKDDADPPRRP